ncbi:MAG: peptidoglycan-binding protein [Desulfotomaculum sp. BICA1-6]|nr:MAG: peptidoglycan-binding protein [Desulfotomaculum sp. BICA1-6]
MGRYPSDCPAGYKSIYFVISGDTVSIIAKRFGTSTKDLIAINPHISNPDMLYPGDALCVPGFRKPVNCPPGFQGRYEVLDGDTMFSVAQKFNISEEKLITSNPHIANPDMIFPFDVLCVPKINQTG